MLCWKPVRTMQGMGSLVPFYADGLGVKKENRKVARKGDKNLLQVFKCAKVPSV